MGHVFTYSISLTQEENYDFVRCSEKSSFKQKYHIRVINVVVQKKFKSLSKKFVEAMQFKLSPVEKVFQKIYGKSSVKLH